MTGVESSWAGYYEQSPRQLLDAKGSFSLSGQTTYQVRLP